MAATKAATNRKIRQEALRDQLSAQGHVQHVIEISNKLYDLDDELDQLKITRLKAAADIKLKLITKYLPDLKQIELDANLHGDRPLLIDLSGGKLIEALGNDSTTAVVDSTLIDTGNITALGHNNLICG